VSRAEAPARSPGAAPEALLSLVRSPARPPPRELVQHAFSDNEPQIDGFVLSGFVNGSRAG